ncbi:alpha-galactosidase-like [Mangifera indica]|uniref:alpha-galactosidase-like n=1 Tax=Mangifera indica TaxID=29780 RepID=UPI001CFA434C|nr:alpha-galactosidase-like [Mangifera indica]
MSYALRKAGSQILYSICEWGEDNPAIWAGVYCNTWRTTGDTADKITSIAGENNIWEDMLDLAGGMVTAKIHPDMLEVGNGGMSIEEYRSHFSIWALMKVWAGPLSKRRVVAVLWNISNSQAPISVRWREVELSPSAHVIVRDLWAHSFISMKKSGGLTANVAPCACKMYILTPV